MIDDKNCYRQLQNVRNVQNVFEDQSAKRTNSNDTKHCCGSVNSAPKSPNRSSSANDHNNDDLLNLDNANKPMNKTVAKQLIDKGEQNSGCSNYYFGYVVTDWQARGDQ